MNVVKDLAEANTTVSLPWFTYKDNCPFFIITFSIYFYGACTYIYDFAEKNLPSFFQPV
jgi:hypothetical protein